jgi:hypothetical protein
MKLGAFAAVLALLFGAAALAGGAVEPLRESAGASGDAMAMDATAVRGLAVSDDDFTLRLARRSAQHGTPFELDGKAHTLADDLSTDGAVSWKPLPAVRSVASVDGFRVRLAEGPTRAGEESRLTFVVMRGGRRIRTQDYLGAKGHLVALREGDLAFLHVHPDAETLDFEATFPSAASYRLFLQFKVDGHVHTAEFTQEVSR